MEDFTARPLAPDTWDDLVAVFGGGDGKGDAGGCWCLWWRVPRERFRALDRPEAKALFRNRVEAGPPPGLVGYASGTPVGWIQVGPRADVPEWNGNGRVTAPLDPGEADDPALWGVSCFVVRAGYRRKGYAGRLLDAAISWARENGAARVDSCPVESDGKRTASALFHGPAQLFRARGFVSQGERRAGRPLLRLTFADH